MTALNWELAPEQVLILSDSLAFDGKDHRPYFVATKVFPLPHLGLCIAGTGAQPIAVRFWAHVNSGCVVEDIQHLDEFSPAILREMWEALLNGPDYAGISDGITCTIYIYGWSKDDQAFVGYAYRSINNFISEPLIHGIGVKPPPASGELPEINGLVDFLHLMIAQKKEDREKPRLERVGIGGDVIMTLMTRDEGGVTVILQQPIHRFEDFDDDWKLILAKLPQNEGHPYSAELLENDP